MTRVIVNNPAAVRRIGGGQLGGDTTTTTTNTTPAVNCFAGTPYLQADGTWGCTNPDGTIPAVGSRAYAKYNDRYRLGMGWPWYASPSYPNPNPNNATPVPTPTPAPAPVAESMLWGVPTKYFVYGGIGIAAILVLFTMSGGSVFGKGK